MTREAISDHLTNIPHAAALDLRYRDLSTDEDFVEITLPYDEKLVGDPDTGVIHGGAITALLDNAAGFAVRVPDPEAPPVAIATLDLRIDYMGPATPGRDVIARATCFKRTRSITFVRGVAYHDSPDDPIATCTATFMTGTPNSTRPLAGGSPAAPPADRPTDTPTDRPDSPTDGPIEGLEP